MIQKYILFDGVRLPFSPDTIEEGCGGGEISTLPSYGDNSTSYVSRQVGVEYISFSFKIPLMNNLSVPRIGENSTRNIRSIEPATGRYVNPEVHGMIQGQRLVDFILDAHVTGRSVPIEVVTVIDNGDGGFNYSMRRLGNYKVQNSEVTYSAGQMATYAFVRLNCIEYLPNVHLHASAVVDSGLSSYVSMLSTIMVGVDAITELVDRFGEIGNVVDAVSNLCSGDASGIIDKIAEKTGFSDIVEAGSSIFNKVSSWLFKSSGPGVRGVFTGVPSLVDGEGFKNVVSGLCGVINKGDGDWPTDTIGNAASGGVSSFFKNFNLVGDGQGGTMFAPAGGAFGTINGFVRDGPAQGFNFNPELRFIDDAKGINGDLKGGYYTPEVINYSPPPSLSQSCGLADTYYNTINDLTVTIAQYDDSYMDTVGVAEGISASSAWGLVIKTAGVLGDILDVFSGGVKKDSNEDWSNTSPSDAPSKPKKPKKRSTDKNPDPNAFNNKMEIVEYHGVDHHMSGHKSNKGGTAKDKIKENVSKAKQKSQSASNKGGNAINKIKENISKAKQKPQSASKTNKRWTYYPKNSRSKVSTRSFVFLYEEDDEFNLCYDSNLYTNYFGVDVVGEWDFGLSEGYFVEV